MWRERKAELCCCLPPSGDVDRQTVARDELDITVDRTGCRNRRVAVRRKRQRSTSTNHYLFPSRCHRHHPVVLLLVPLADRCNAGCALRHDVRDEQGRITGIDRSDRVAVLILHVDTPKRVRVERHTRVVYDRAGRAVPDRGKEGGYPCSERGGNDEFRALHYLAVSSECACSCHVAVVLCDESGESGLNERELRLL